MGDDKFEPIAIVGAACRFAGEISSLGDLWDIISKTKTGHCKIPNDRWDADTWHHPDPDRKGGIAVKDGYFLKHDVGQFDAPFFSTTEKEAAAMDPMKRLLLEVAYESIENGYFTAGIRVENLMNSQTGCYVGCMTNDYEMMSLHDIYDVGHAAASATSEAMIANRVSWFFGLRGPSLTLDTACSSSLYALHLACQSLRLGETEMAKSLVAGVNLILNPNTMHQLSAMHMLSPEGISHTFDDRANGYGRGEGIGCLIVKRLSDAIRDGDTIRCVIRGTGVNADGKTPSITQPSSTAQADLIVRTYKAAGLSMASTQYFESHGTGTPVGDPIEMSAIGSTLGASRADANLGPLYVGSIKPTVGHTEGCSGLAGVFKAITCLERGMLVPTYGVGRLNPRLTLAEWNIALPSETMRWPEKGQRRISVNSFGFGGANAHVILDDAYHYLADRGLVGNHSTTLNETDDEAASDSGVSSMGSVTPSDEGILTKQLFVFSTKDQAGIQRLASSYASYLDTAAIADKEDFRFLSNLAHTLSLRRSHLDFRSFAVASSRKELSTKLSKGLLKLPRSSRQYQNPVFVFTGQGAQWPGMGAQLISHSIFQESIQASQSYLKVLGCRWNIVEELEKDSIHFPQYSQTLCTVLQVALVDLLRSWNVIPGATVGHSSGEIAAAYAASLISHADAIKIAYVRGLSSAEVTQPGAMLAAGLSTKEASQYLSFVPHEAAVVACVNSPSSVTLSGDVDAIDKLEAIISADGKFARKLKVKTAYHSPHMRKVSQGYFDRMGNLSISTSEGDPDAIKPLMFSSLKGRIIESPDELDAEYWVSNMENTVQFSAAVSALLKHPQAGKKVPIRWGSFVELGPHTALKGPVQQIISANSTSKAVKDAPYLSMIERGKNAIDTALDAAGRLWASGHHVNLAALNSAIHSRGNLAGDAVLTDLPRYPWNHNKRFWHESYLMRSNRFPSAPRTDLLGVPEDLSSTFEPRWRNHLRLSENPWIEDHKITGTILYPAAGMLVMALEGALQLVNEGDRSKLMGFRFREVRFERGLVVPTGEAAVETRLSLIPHSTIPGEYKFTVFSTTSGTTWMKHCFGTVSLVYTMRYSDIEELQADLEWQQRSLVYQQLSRDTTADQVDVDNFYDHLERIGMEYGPLFRNVVELAALPDRRAAHAKIVLPDTLSSMPANFEYPHIMHPATMDSIFHLLLAALNNGRPVAEAAVPYGIKEMFVAYDQPHDAGALFAGYGKLVNKSADGHELVGDLIISDESWSGPKLTITGFTLRQVTSTEGANNSSASDAAGLSKCAELVWSPDPDFLQNTSKYSEAESQLSQWLDSFALKGPIGAVLVVLGNGQSPDTVKIVQRLYDCVGHRPGGDNIKIMGQTTALEAIRSILPIPESSTEIWDFSNTKSVLTLETSFDAIIIPNSLAHINEVTLRKLRDSLSPHGRLAASYNSQSEQLHDILSAAGLVDVVKSSGFFVASASLPQSPILPTEVYILNVTGKESSFESAITKILSPVTTVNISTMSNAPTLAGKHVISLLEIDQPFIYSWSEKEFNSFRGLVSSAAHVFWLTRGGLLDAWAGGVEFAPAQGLLRVLRNEYPLVTLPHLDLSVGFDLADPGNVNLILDVWKTSLVPDGELEFAERDGTIHIPRAVSQTAFDNELQLARGQAKPVRRSLDDLGTAMKPTSSAQGANFLWLEDNDAEKPLAPREVEVAIQFVTLKRQDAEKSHDGLGQEAVGVITRCGSHVNSVLPGQKVVLLHRGCFKTHVRLDEGLVVVLPAQWNGEQAAASAGAFVEAQYALLEVAGLQRGQPILVHSAASPLGQAAIQVAQMVGAQIFTLVDTQTDKKLLMEQYGIPSTSIYDSARETFVPSILEATNGLGPQVILSVLPGPAVVGSLAILGDGGFFIDISDGGIGRQETHLPNSKRNASLVRIDMDHVGKSKGQLISSIFQRTFNTFARYGLIKPITALPLFCVSDTSRALATLNSPEHSNPRVVVSFGNSASILTPPEPAQKLKLDLNGTYILAGGLGALGLDIAHMMVEAGAGHLVFLSRSGGAKNTTDLEALRARGARIDAFPCNVNDASGVAQVFAKLRNAGCVIKGLMQAAMVLEDGIFDNMTYDKWFRAFEPKTRGSRHLLEQLTLSAKASSSSPPFFLLLSSITGIIGNTAQANYASGNTFEDALAQYARTHLGIPATSIDIGLVSDSSHFTSEGEFGDLENYLHRYSHGWKGLQCSMEELRVVMAGLMRRAEQQGINTSPVQIVLGLSDGLIQKQGSSGFEHDRKFALRVIDNGGAMGSGDGKGASIGDMLKEASSLADAATVIEDDLKAQISVAIGVAVSEVDGQKPLFDFGVDSLKAVEIRNRALKELQSDISVFELLSATPLTDLAVKIAAQSAIINVQEKSN
ncbi:lovastatin nonaketide synthase [Corynespora cassiicola Philippines]|uniref:Lovastatin nonaketide synthase n=1 Tax=Corynespora cassiicola Philippines TaxID=1448308 RepID=A0A2T2N1T1_CORCC|nr:lovastatin nonaketide synthase [Corynespora cassiicola Philippines]